MGRAKYAILSLLVSYSNLSTAQTPYNPDPQQPRTARLSIKGTGCSQSTTEAKEGLSRWSYAFSDFKARGYPVLATRPDCRIRHVYQIEPDWQYRIASVEGTVTGQLASGAQGDISVSYFRERSSDNEPYPPTATTQASALTNLNGSMKFSGKNPNGDWTPCGLTQVAYSISPRIRLIQAGAQDLLRFNRVEVSWEKRECPRRPALSDTKIMPTPLPSPLSDPSLQ